MDVKGKTVEIKIISDNENETVLQISIDERLYGFPIEIKKDGSIVDKVDGGEYY